MTCIIIDDEPYSRMSIIGVLAEINMNVEVLAECSNIAQGVKAVYKYKPNIIFLDVEMPYQNGFALNEYFYKENINFQTIFVTAYNPSHMQHFDSNNIDYLLKPVRKESMEKVLRRIENEILKASDI